MAKKASKPSSSPRKRWTFELGPAGVIGLGSVAALIMAWLFILGVLVGRGYKPESVILEFGHFVPPLIKGESGGDSPKPLLPEELRFFDTLKEKAKQPAMPPAPPRREAIPEVRPTPPAAQEPTKAASPSLPPTLQSVQTVPAAERFEFVYQAAAFRTEAQARAFQQRISDVGGAVSVEMSVLDGRSWYRALVTIRGSAADAKQVKVRLRGHGITDPFLRQKKSL